MTAILGTNSYGKSGVRLLKVSRHGARHEIRELTVAIALEGEFTTAHTTGDNSMVLPTDTMKNTVYAKARELDLDAPEDFAIALARHFLDASTAARSARVSVKEHGWKRMTVDGSEHGHSFERAGNELRSATVTLARDGAPQVAAGIEDWLVLKSAQSAFSGYPRDRFTTLKETEDRVLATSISTEWRYKPGTAEFDVRFTAVRSALLTTFAGHESKSVQHTLYAMGEAVLSQVSDIAEITLTMPNKHHLLVDLAPLGMDNPNEIFVPTAEPYGLITATIKRG